MESKKKWYRSSTIQLAILQAIAGIITAILAHNPELQTVGLVMLSKSFVDFGIRLITQKEIQL